MSPSVSENAVLHLSCLKKDPNKIRLLCLVWCPLCLSILTWILFFLFGIIGYERNGAHCYGRFTPWVCGGYFLVVLWLLLSSPVLPVESKFKDSGRCVFQQEHHTDGALLMKSLQDRGSMVLPVLVLRTIHMFRWFPDISMAYRDKR